MLDPGLLTVAVATIVAAPGFVMSYLAYKGIMRAQQAIHETSHEIEKVHVIVNSQKTAMQTEIHELREIITRGMQKGGLASTTLDQVKESSDK